MIHNSMRSTRLLNWRSLRWGIAIPSLPLVWWACASHPLTQPVPQPEQQTDIYISVAPNRQLDLVFMVDNSPSMAPKVSKMNANFPKLIEALRDPNDKTLPDLRVALIDSDLGTNGAYAPPGSCAEKTLADGTSSKFGDLGRFQMLSSPTACTFNAGDLYLEVKANAALNYTGDINTVFACLASNLGTLGCGEEHQLQAFEFALAAKQIGNETQQAMLRPSAYLGLVFLTDEDDCSAATNDGLFGDKAELRGESASLRCATRSHMCGGQNLNKSGPNYPTTGPYSHAFNDCEPRLGDECSGSTDTSVATDCNPLKNYATLAAEMKALKSDPDNQLLVAGIFGWPLNADDLAKAQYKIALIPNPNGQDVNHPQVYDYWPVCYDPGHMPATATTDAATGFDATAAGWGATGGLRESKFVDEFGTNGLKFSICQPDFSSSMKVIGDAIAKKLQNLCVDYKLIDTNTKKDGLQPDCRVVWRIPKPDPANPNKTIYEESSTGLPICPDGATNGNVTTDCWQLVTGTEADTKCPPKPPLTHGQLINVLRTAQEVKDKPQLDPGTKIGMQCRTCTDDLPNPTPEYMLTDAYLQCHY